MVFIWYFNGIYIGVKALSRGIFNEGEKHGDSREKTIFIVIIWRYQIFCLFLHVEYQTNNINPQNLYNKKQKVKRN